MAKIKLNEVPEEGRNYSYNRQTGELNEDLKDLIGSNEYQTEFFLKPLNHKDFSLRGHVVTATQEICSLCGETFNFKTKAQLNEIIIPGADNNKILEKQSRANHVSETSESEISVSEYKNDVLEIGELIHEAIALSVPFNPKPEQKEDGSCTICDKVAEFGQFGYDENMGIIEKQNPFNVLKDFKIKNQKSN